MGDLEKAGVIATVRARRDALDVPHIFGSTDRDVLYALGRAHARDRFFQMDVLRHTFSGTLAELVGKDALASDVQLRTLGLRRAAEASLPVQSQETRVWLEAYARGVNSYILDAANALPPEYAALELTRASIHPWTSTDSLTIAKGLAFGLSFDLSDIDLTTALAAFQAVGSPTTFDGTILFFKDVYRAAPFDPTHSLPATQPPPGSSGGPTVTGDKAAAERRHQGGGQGSPALAADGGARRPVSREGGGGPPAPRRAREAPERARQQLVGGERQGHRHHPADPRQRPPSQPGQSQHLL